MYMMLTSADPTFVAVPEIDLDIVMSQGVFQDASMVNLDFLNTPDWMEALPDAAM